MAFILVADDDEAVRETIAEFLTRAGHTPLPVADGKQALEVLDQLGAGVELVITDMLMPERDGIEVVMECTKRGVKVIGMSGEDRAASWGVLTPARQLGAVAVLRKPFDTGQLLEAVGNALGGASPRFPGKE